MLRIVFQLADDGVVILVRIVSEGAPLPRARSPRHSRNWTPERPSPSASSP
ncbi:hypothetical protein MA3A0119R_4427 [Mycobacteroides abscessus 3A-0119-R]|nr:hypothetical protein MA3A0119R_4427 [Mycobacteroides abscessus 3A-0119-R]